MSHKYDAWTIHITDEQYAEWANFKGPLSPTQKWTFNEGDLVTIPPATRVYTVKTRWHDMDVYEVVDNQGFTYFIKSDQLKYHRAGSCECGKDKFGFGGHTTWCPLFKENFK